MTSDRTGNLRYLMFVCSVSALGGFLFGFDTAVISGTVGFVKAQFGLNALQEGWFVASALLGCILGVTSAGILADRFGRKAVLFLSAVLFALSAVGCTFAPGEIVLIFSRIVGGLGIGVASMLAPLYISEISIPAYRGRMVTLYQLAITVGILAAYYSNALLLSWSNTYAGESAVLRWIVAGQVWRGMFAVGVVPAALFFLLLFFIPQSPRWLTARGRADEARTILARVNGPETAAREVAEIQAALAQETGSMRQLFAPGLRRALFLGVSIAVLSQLTGINVIIYYGPKIFTEAGFRISESLDSQVIIGIVNVLATVLALWKIDHFGRKPLLLAGVIGMLAALLCIAGFFLAGSHSSVLLVVCILLYVTCFAFSFGCVTWTILAEFYPTHIRGRAMSIATFTLWSGTFIIGQAFPWLLETLGGAGAFAVFACMCVPAILITWKLLPETKGKTLEEIEQFWLRGARAGGSSAP
ncbi:MAG TPA: sugar porter family MFS transporter [Bacteroidota bacterium]|nr:sugar porter family MFS transporter [Bacteroidota bacterium]